MKDAKGRTVRKGTAEITAHKNLLDYCEIISSL